MSYFVKEADGNFHYSYYGVVDWVMAEYVNPQGIEVYIENEQFSNAVKGSYKDTDLTGCIRRSPPAAGAVVNGRSAVPAAGP